RRIVIVARDVRTQLRARVALDPEVAEVRLRRDDAGRRRVGLAHGPRQRGAAAGAEQQPDVLFGLAVLAFAEVDVADVAGLVEEVLRRPELVRVRVPRL